MLVLPASMQKWTLRTNPTPHLSTDMVLKRRPNAHRQLCDVECYSTAIACCSEGLPACIEVMSNVFTASMLSLSSLRGYTAVFS